MDFAAPASLTDQIAEHLGTEIIAGRLRPRARIQELKVAGNLGVSRGSVREALLILERRHLVELLPRRGAVVTSLEPAAVIECMELLTELQVLFYGKLADHKRRELMPWERSLQAMAGATQSNDLAAMIAARRSFLGAGVAELNGYHLAALLDGLQPAGLRIAYLAAAHPEYELRDALRLHQALLEAIIHGDRTRIRELVAAFNAREARLALAQLGQRIAGCA
jgi:DNA-binding GntR family transcriptional regulator